MPELQFLKTQIFPRALQKLQSWVNFFLFKCGKIKRWKRWVMYVVCCYKQVSDVSCKVGHNCSHICTQMTFIISVLPN